MKNYKLKVINFISAENMSENAERTALRLCDILDDTIINASDINVLTTLLNGLVESEDVMSVSISKKDIYEIHVIYDETKLYYTIITLLDAYENDLESPLITDIIGDLSKYGLLYILGRSNDRKEDK